METSKARPESRDDGTTPRHDDAPARDAPSRHALSDRGAKAAERRARIVEAARTLFARQGFHATGIAEISKHSGVRVGQIYRDFACKEAIVAAIAERGIDRFLNEEALRGACRHGCEQDVRRWIERFVGGHELEDARLIVEIMAETARNPRIAEIFDDCDARMQRRLIAALRMMVPPDTPEPRLLCLAQLVMTLSMGVFQRRLAGRAPVADDVLGALMDCVDREIRAVRTAA